MKSFSRRVIIEYNSAAPQWRAVGSVREAAECLLGLWPEGSRGGVSFRTALDACRSCLKGDLSPESARQAFIDAAMHAGIFVR
ncbi:MAG: DUF982 domain-containing protein, partial [Microvirga sp.]